MKTANEFYADCLEGFIAVSKGFGCANGGALGNEVLAKRAEQSVRELLKFKPLIQLFGKDPTMYYYYINGLSFAMGVVLAMLQANAPEKFADRNLIPMIVCDPETSAHDLAFHTLQQFGMAPEIYNQLVQDLYKKFQELHEPYWKAKEPRDYTLAAFYASFMTGCSIALGKFVERRAQQQAAPSAPVEKKAAPEKKPATKKPATKKATAKKSTVKKIVIALLGVMLLQAASATVIDASLIQTSGEPSVGSGKFYGYRTVTDGPGDDAFTKAKALAEEKHLPLVVIWSNENCTHCDAFAADCNRKKSAVTTWLKSVRAVVVYFKSDSGDDPPARADAPKASSDAYYFAYESCKARPAWPLIGVYYKKADGTAATWGTPYGADTDSKNFAYLQTKVAAFLEDNHIGDYPGGTFAVSGTACDRYEMEPATESFDVELVRGVENAQFAATNTLNAFWPGEDGAYFTQKVEWTAGEQSAWVSVPRKAAVPFPEDGAEIILRVGDEYGNLTCETPVVCRTGLEVSSANPKWIGEKFGFGEWTMDLEAAKKLVAAAEGSAYTVVSMQGSLWCPDCANVDRNFLGVTNAAGENAFAKWAASKQVALVSIDIPNFTNTVGNFSTPTLLSRRAAVSTLARSKEYPQSGAEESLLTATLRSGVGYLSRKGVDVTTAAQYLERNHILASVNTDRGGFHRPEDGNANRTGVPIFVLLRKDGTVAARLTRMASVSPMAADHANFNNYIRRFEEMMALADAAGAHADATEIANNFADSGAIVVPVGGVASNELCHADFQDTFRVDGFGGGMHGRAVVQGPDGAVVNVSIVRTNELGKLVTLATASGRLSDTVIVDAGLEQNTDYFVQVKGRDITDGSFRVENSAAMVFHPYTIWPGALLIPTERTSETYVPAETNRVAMRIAKDSVYRIFGIETPPAGVFRSKGAAPAGLAGQLYEAQVSGDVELTATAFGGRIEFQLWHPGTIAFEWESDWVTEYNGTGVVRVVRTDGSSAAVTARVRCVDGAVSSTGRYVWKDQMVSWADGETGSKEVGFSVIPVAGYQEDESFVLALSFVGETATALCEPTNCTITVRDTDAPCLKQSVYEVAALKNFSSTVEFDVVNLREGGRVTVTRAKGSAALPSGLKIAYDSKAGKVVLSGVPTKAGTYEFTLTVSERRKGGTATGFETTLKITVGDPVEKNALVAVKRPAQKLAFFEQDGSGYDRLVGLLDLSITAKGKISAKFSGMDAKTYSFSGNWTEQTEDGTVHTKLNSKGIPLTLSMDADGRVKAYIDSAILENLSAAADWPKTGIYDDFKGYYNCMLAAAGTGTWANGNGFLTLTITSSSCVKNGSVRYAGVLADGTSVSGCADLRDCRTVIDDDRGIDNDQAELPVFAKAGKNCLGAALSLLSGGAKNWQAENANLREVVFTRKGTMPYGHYYVNGEYNYHDFTAYGAYYLPGLTLEDVKELFYVSKFGADVRFAVSGYDLEIKRVNRYGVFSGSVRHVREDGRTVNASYRGVLVPGWINSCNCGYSAPERPLGGGTLYFRDQVKGRAVPGFLPLTLDRDLGE